jgi:hypothetical protein
MVVRAEVIFVVELARVALFADVTVKDIDRVGEGIVPLQGRSVEVLGTLLERRTGGILVDRDDRQNLGGSSRKFQLFLCTSYVSDVGGCYRKKHWGGE